MKNTVRFIQISLFVLLIALDQYTKYIAVTYLKPIGSLPVINGVLGLTYVTNEGAAFGIFQGGRWFFVIVTSIVLLAIVYYYFKLPDGKIYRSVKAALAVISAGAVGNVLDRLFNADGKVIDFLEVQFIKFPVFNLADVYVVVGTIALAFMLIFMMKNESRDALSIAEKEI